jgi:hypothetical protein
MPAVERNDRRIEFRPRANRQNDPNCHKSGKFDTLPVIMEAQRELRGSDRSRRGFEADGNAITVSHRG